MTVWHWKTDEQFRSRARERHSPCPDGKAARVDYIADLMRRGEFRTGRTCYELYVAWEGVVGHVCIEKDIGEASRRVRSEIHDSDASRVEVHERLMGVLRDGDAKEATAAAKVLVDVLGMKAPTKLEAKVDHGTFGRMTPEELADSVIDAAIAEATRSPERREKLRRALGEMP